MRIILTVLLAVFLFGCSIETGLQQQMQNESRQYSCARDTKTEITTNISESLNKKTEVMKVKHDTAKNSISNVR